MRRKLAYSRLAVEYTTARELVGELGHLPLAISQASAYIRMRGGDRPMEKYLDLFRKNARHALGKLPAAAVWDYRNDTVLTTYEISLAAIETAHPLASKILTISGFMSRLDVWESLLESWLGLGSLGKSAVPSVPPKGMV